jgi:hypothetical protein
MWNKIGRDLKKEINISFNLLCTCSLAYIFLSSYRGTDLYKYKKYIIEKREISLLKQDRAFFKSLEHI